jgi:hypothetical protein
MVTKIKVGSAIGFLEDEAVLRKRVKGVSGEQIFHCGVKFCSYG